MRSRASCLVQAAAVAALIPAIGAAEDAQRPLSAIEWLNELEETITRAPGPDGQAALAEPPVAGEVSIPEVQTTALAGATSGAVGLLPSSVTGLPGSLWAESNAKDLTALWRRASSEPPHAITALYHTLLLAEAEPPSGPGDAYLRTRVGMLRQLGAVEPARELLARAGPETPALFGAWFDLALLAGAETEACTALRDAPGLLMDDAARIYCATLTGDWSTAALLYDTGAALGTMGGTTGTLLAQFLDPDLTEEGAPPIPSAAPTPLEFRLFEAIGAPLPTRTLPLAFAMADLRGTIGWKAEIEAAERLTRAGALAPGRLFGLYTRQKPSASGGVWDRARAVQRLDAALVRGDTEASGDALKAAWPLMRAEGLDVAFAQIFAERLHSGALPDAFADLAFRLALLTPDYEAAAPRAGPERAARLLAGVATGQPDPALSNRPDEAMIASAFAQPPKATPEHAALIAEGRLGEAILSAAIQFDTAGGDPGQMADALGTLRAVGLEDMARRAALQALIRGTDT